uniref:Uncharacterized protein n=1 Tax=Anopheles farauti TaxID=69004 RepID=A0A182QE67_9DIPT
MAQCKVRKTVSFATPIRQEWSKAYLVRPKNNLVAHPDSNRKQSFRPSYEQEGEPKMDNLMDWTYGRTWYSEVEEYRRSRTAREKTPKKKFPIYSDCKSKGTKETAKGPSSAKHSQNVTSKGDAARATVRRPLGL